MIRLGLWETDWQGLALEVGLALAKVQVERNWALTGRGGRGVKSGTLVVGEQRWGMGDQRLTPGPACGQ